VDVLLGNGDGTFQAPVDYNAGMILASSVIVTDVNGDGILDIVVAGCCSTFQQCGNDGIVGVLLGKGDGTFEPVVTYSSGGVTAVSVTAADVNDDGKLDLLVANQCATSSCVNGSVGVLLGNGSGTFQAAVAYSSGGLYASGIAAADLAGNGKLDLVVTNFCAMNPCGNYPYSDGTVGVLPGNGDGTFQPVVLYDSGGASTSSVALADVNGDGKLDILTANCGTESCGPASPEGTVGVLLGNGDGTFRTPASYEAANGPISIAIADMNGDGKQDVVVANWGTSENPPTNNGAGSVLLGNGDGTFQPVQTYLSGGNEATSVAVADLTGNGRPDIVLGDYSSNGANPPPGIVSVLLNAGASDQSPTTTTLTSSLDPSNYGQTVKFTAAVTSSSGTPTGTVTLYDTSTSATLGSATLISGTASLSVPSLAAGTHSITAAYQGSISFAASTSVPLSQTVNAATTTTGLTSSLNPAGTNQTITFTATVASQYGGAATGSVTFYSGTQTLGTSTLSGNRATLSTSFSTAGTYAITAKYNADANNLGSTSSVLSEVINAALISTTTTLTSAPNPSLVGQSVTFTATVTSTAGSPPNGETVTFYNSSAILGTASLSAGIATLTTASLPLGTFTITATYGGGANFAASTSPGLRQVVNSTTRYATSTALASSLNPSASGQSVTFIAAVTSTGGTPPNGEAVTFYNGLNAIGTAPLSGGTASFTTSSLQAGTHAISAAYLGDANFTASTSPTLQQVVDTKTQSPTTTALTSSANPSIYGQKVTWTATVTTAGSIAPTGKVSFTWGDGNSLGAVTLNASGVATLTLSDLDADAYPLIATYNGDTNNGPSVSSILNQTVMQATSTATLSSSPNPSTQGEAVTFTAKITSPTATPTGPVTFTAGKTTLGTVELTAGKAEFTTSTLPAGTNTITVTYPWNSDIAASSASVTQVVQQ
jgi:hypothetical protein